MAHPLDYKVYARPRGGRKFMIAKFLDGIDAVNFAHEKSKHPDYRENHTVSACWHDGKIWRKFANGVSV